MVETRSNIQTFYASTSQPLPIILDGDPGHDDAIAWVLARSRPELRILCVTSVCGNQTIEKTTYNAGRIMALLGMDVPLAMGLPKPLFRDPIIADTVHGKTGLDGPELPEPVKSPVACSAAELMAQCLKESDEPVVIVPTGPLTNVGALLLLYPELRSKIRHISLMGGGIARGNWTPAAEFNILVDPDAAKIVFESGIPITMAGLDVTERALVYPEDFERIRRVGNHVASVVAGWLEFFYHFHQSLGYPGAPVHDAVAVTALIRPEILTGEDLYVQVETKGVFCRGATVGDLNKVSGRPPNAYCLKDINRNAFVDLLVEAVTYYG
ncbi:MAG: nucleoside hydrolase [Saccharofermentanales bacterium]